MCSMQRVSGAFGLTNNASVKVSSVSVPAVMNIAARAAYSGWNSRLVISDTEHVLHREK